MNSRWLGRIFSRAASGENHAARSISGNDCLRPLFGGHSSSNELDLTSAGSRSPSTAQAPRSFLAQNGPPGCTSSTDQPFGSLRTIKMPALCLGIFAPDRPMLAAVRRDELPEP